MTPLGELQNVTLPDLDISILLFSSPTPYAAGAYPPPRARYTQRRSALPRAPAAFLNPGRRSTYPPRGKCYARCYRPPRVGLFVDASFVD